MEKGMGIRRKAGGRGSRRIQRGRESVVGMKNEKKIFKNVYKNSNNKKQC